MPQNLPERVVLSDGYTRTALHELTPSELNSLGFYEVTETFPVLSAGQKYGTPVMSISGGAVTASYPVWGITNPPIREISGIAFLRRFTAPQRIAARELAKTDPYAADFWGMFDATIASKGTINLDDQDTIAGVGYLASALPEQDIDPAVILA